MNLLQHANKLYEQGFAVIPTKEDKSPIPKAWPSLVGDNRLVPNGEYDNAIGCGVVLGHWQDRGYLHCLDIDCYHKEISRAMCEYIAQVIDTEKYPFRVGQSPKFAVPILLPEPWTKATSSLVARVNDEPKDSQVELLGVGQQFVAYGAHPEGKKGQYQWYNGELNLDEVPLITNEQLVLILTHFDVLCGDDGRTQLRPPNYTKHTAHDLDDLDVVINNQPLGLTKQEIKSALANFPAQGLEYHDWCMVGMALWHEYEGSEAGYQRWLRWSKKSDKHVERGMSRKWLSFEPDGWSKPITMRSVIKRGKAADLPALEEIEEIEEIEEFRFLHPSVDDLAAGQHTEWLLQGIIETRTIGQIFGPPGTGKSFLALDIAVHVANGEDWDNHKTPVPGNVVFLAGEGIKNLQRRKAVIAQEKALDTAGVIVSSMPDFTNVEQLKLLVREIEAAGGCRLLFVDTLARAMVGLNENDTGDMGRMIKVFEWLAKKLKCAICIVHHTSKANTGAARGSGALTGAMDFEIALEMDDDRNVVMRCAKAKDVEPFDDKAFNLPSIELPGNFTDNCNSVVTSSMIEWVPMDDVKKVTRVTGFQKQLLNSYEAVFSDLANRVAVPAQHLREHGIEGSAQGVPCDLVKDYFDRSQDQGVKYDTRKKRWDRSLTEVQNKKRLWLFDDVLVQL